MYIVSQIAFASIWANSPKHATLSWCVVVVAHPMGKLVYTLHLQNSVFTRQNVVCMESKTLDLVVVYFLFYFLKTNLCIQQFER